MAKLVKIVDNKYVQIEEYKNPNICFNTNEYSDFEDYCTLRETFDPFRMFYENKELKSELELYKNGVYFSSEVDEKDKQIDKLKTQQKEFIKYLEDELDRLARECSNIYEDSLGHTRLVNEDKFNEVNKILSKYKKIIGVSDENSKN